MSVDMRDLAQDAVLCRRISPQIYHAMLHEPTLQTDEFEALYLAWWNANEAFEKAYEKYEADTISWFPFYPSALDLAVQRARQNMAEYCSRQDTVTRVLEHASQNKVLKKAQVIFAERHAQDLNASSWGDVLSNLCSEITPSKILLGLATVNFAAAQPVLNHVFPNTNNAENITGGMSVGLPKSVSPAKVSSPALESAKNRQKREKKQQKVEDIFVTTEPSLKKSITDFRKAYLKFYKGNSAAVITADVLSTDSRDHGILMKEAGAFLGRYSSDIQEGKRKYPELIASLEEHAPYSAGASLMLAVIHVLGGGNSDDAVMLYVQAYLKLPSLFEGEDNYSWAEGFLGAVTFRMKIALDALGALTKEEDYVQEKNLLVLGEVRVLSDLAKAVHENLKPYGNPMNTKTLVLAEEMMGVVKVWEKAIQTAQEKLAKQKHVDVKQPKKETVVPKSEKVAAAPVTTDQALKDVLFELVTFYKTQPVSQKGFVSSKGGLFQEGTILPEVMTMGMQVMANFDSSHKGASAGYNAYLKKNPSVRDKIFAEATKGNGYASYLLASIQPEGQPEAVVFAAQCVRKPDKKDKNPYAGVELFLNVAQQRLDTLKGNASAQDEIAHIEIAMKAVREYQDHAKNPKKVSEESKPLQEDIDWILSGIAKSGKQKEYTQRLGLDLTLKSFTVLSPSDRWDLNNAFSLSKLEQDIITIRDYAFRGSKEALRYMYVAATHETRFADAALVALQAVRLEPTEEHYVDLHNAIASILDREYPKIGGMLEDRDTFDPVYYDQMLRWFEISRRALEHITVESSIYKKMFNRWSDLITRDAFAKTGVQILPKPASQADYKNYHNALASASPGESVIEIHMTWASKGVVDASLALIDLYRKGYEISQSFDQARLLYRIALIQAGNDQAKRKQVEEKWPLIEPRSAESPINWLIARVTGIEERALPRGLVGPIVVTMIFIHVLLLSSLYSMAKRFFRRQPERVIEQPKKESPPKLKKQRKTPQESAAKVKDGEYKKLCAEFDAMKARFEKLKRKQEQYQLEKCKAPIKACEIIFAKTYSVETIAELKQDIETLKIHCAELENIIDLHEKSEEKNKKYTAVLAALDKVKTDALSVAAVPDCIALKKTTVETEQKKLQSDRESLTKAKDWAGAKEAEKGIAKLGREIAVLDEQLRKYEMFVQRCKDTTAEKYAVTALDDLERVVTELKKTLADLIEILKENQDAVQTKIQAEKEAHAKQQAVLYAERQALLEVFEKKFVKSMAFAQECIQRTSAQLVEMQGKDLPRDDFKAFERVCNHFTEKCIELITLLTCSHENMSNDKLRAHIDSCEAADVVLNPAHPDQITVARQYDELLFILAEKARIAEARRRAEDELNNDNNKHAGAEVSDDTEKKLVRMDSVKALHVEYARELTPAELARKQRTEKQERNIGWMAHPVNQLLLKLAESVNDASHDYAFFPEVGKYSLLYRLHELQLFLLTAFHYHHRDKNLEQDPVVIPLLFQSKAVGEFATEFWNLLMHSFDKVTREELLQCVKAAYCVETGKIIKNKLVCDPKMFDESVREVICDSMLYKTLMRDQGAKPHQTVMELLGTLEKIFEDLAKVGRFATKDSGNKSLPHYQESCRMIIMIMGEINQRIRFVEQGEALLGNALFKGKLAKFLEACHKVVRNPLRHGRTDVEYQELQRFEQLIKDVKNAKNEKNYSELREKIDEAARLQELIYRRFKDTHEDAIAKRSVCIDVIGIDKVFELVDAGQTLFKGNPKLFEEIRGTMRKWLKRNGGEKPVVTEKRNTK